MPTGNTESQKPEATDAPSRGTLSAGLSFGAVSFMGTTIAGMFTSVFIARLYGVKVVGEFALVYAPVLAVWLLSTVREQPALQREVAVLPPRHPRVTGLFAAVFTFSTGLTVAVAGIATIIVYFLFQGPIDHPELFMPALASLVGYTILTNSCVNFDSIFVAFRDGRNLFWLRMHQVVGYLILIVVGRAISGSVWVLVAATAFSWFLPLIQRLIIVRKWMRLIVSRAEMRAGFTALPEILRFGLKLTPAGLLWGACDQMGTWVLGSVSTIAAVGAYNRAWFLGQRLLTAQQFLSELLFPTLVERRGTNDHAGHDRALVDCLRYTTAFLLMFAAVGGGAATSIMAVFGPGFEKASTALVYLLLVPVSTTMIAVLSQALIAQGRPVATSVTAGVRLIFTFPSVLILAKSMGITGAALGMALGGAVQLVYQLAVVQRDAFRMFGHLWPTRQMLGQLAAYAAGFAAARGTITVAPGYVGLAVALVAGVVAYLAALGLVGGLVQSDRNRIQLVISYLTKLLGSLRRNVAAPSTVAASGVGETPGRQSA